jgi:hypothetical protein
VVDDDEMRNSAAVSSWIGRREFRGMFVNGEGMESGEEVHSLCLTDFRERPCG